MQNLFDELKSALENDDRFVVGGQLLKNKIVECALNLDSDLLKIVLGVPVLKYHFFKDIDGVLVFDKIKFQQFVSNKSFLPDSFTAYKNKIGLVADGKYLTESQEVVLAWPYKDCVLEGGQTKEETKRKEIFWNETLAPDEIDRLLSPKLFTNFKRYDKNGVHEVKEVSKKDNLIVKGNNLIALTSLLEVYRGQVKLIYIDPPFNTGDDSFRYNDNFNHSTWLTFLKNRLVIARDLMASDGMIFVHIGLEEGAYLKVLMDEIFIRYNWINTFTITTNDASGFKATGKAIFSTANQIHFYAKNKDSIQLSKQYIETKYDANYKYVLTNQSESFENWEYRSISSIVASTLGFDSAKVAKKQLGEEFQAEIAKYALLNASKVFRTAAIGGGARIKRINTIEKSIKQKEKIFIHPNDDIDEFYILNGENIVFYNKRLIEIDGKVVAGQMLTDVWSDIKVTGIAREGDVKLKNGKKPEKLIQRILEIGTQKGDLVLDFHLGSGTTAAVAHKMGRRYIGVEQMDYIETISVERLKKVVEGEQGGVSKSLDWKGGGNFIYCELAQSNQKFIDQIQNANTNNELQIIYSQMCETAFLSYQFDRTLINPSSEDFKNLDLEDQKRVLVSILDKNMLYVPFSEMEDETFGISEGDKALNKMFYSKE